ncbi:MAG: ComEC/Rec2 family competence protein [bacterium]|nr:ComEC/Rec2 family competence protein [bacterium]
MRASYFYTLAAGFALGIFLRSFFDFGLAFSGLLLLLVAFCTGIFFSAKARASAMLALALFGGALGYARMHAAAAPPSAALFAHVGEEVTLAGIVSDEPDRREAYTNVVLRLLSGEDSRVLVRTDAYGDISYGGTIRAKGILEAPENFEGDTGRMFNYAWYLAKDRVHFILNFPEVEVVAHGAGGILKRILLSVKQKYLEAIHEAIPEPAAALAGGITVGDKRSLGNELSDDFRRTGIIHIVVLSGYNITVIMVFFAFIFMKLPERIRLAAAGVAIILFTILVGASATVVRAAAMGILAGLARTIGRTYAITRALFIAGLAMLLWNPYLLAFDPSFQLSFIATLGLIFGTPMVLPYISFIPQAFKLREIAAATIATQIAVMPMLIYMMGNISLVALLVNLLIIPIIPPAMLFVFLTGVVGMLSGTLALPFSYASYALLQYSLAVVDTFAQFPFASLAVPPVSFFLIVLAYTALAAIVLKYNKGQTEFVPTPLR